MTGNRNLAIAFVFAFILITSFVVAEASNYTVGMFRLYSGDSNVDFLGFNEINLTATCNGAAPSSIYEDNSWIYVVFNGNSCDSSSNIKIYASKGSLIYDGSSPVQKCVLNSSEDYGSCSSGGADNVVNYAYGVYELKEPTITKKASSRHSSSSSSSSTSKVVKNNTNSTNVTVSNLTLADIEEEKAAIETNQTQESEESGSSITGAVIGVIKNNSAIVALLFIAGVLVAYMFVLKRRKAYY